LWNCIRQRREQNMESELENALQQLKIITPASFQWAPGRIGIEKFVFCSIRLSRGHFGRARARRYYRLDQRGDLIVTQTLLVVGRFSETLVHIVQFFAR
jgi:hypothetical protein